MVRSEAGFSYDAKCKRVSVGSRSTTRTTQGAGGTGTSMSPGGASGSLAPDEKQPDALPLRGADWFYTRRACERSPRVRE